MRANAGGAREAALAIATGLGTCGQQTVILQDRNNTIVRLLPGAIVAKVGTSHFRDARLKSLDRDLAVVSHLLACGAPVIQPTRAVAAGPHRWQGLTVTLCEYVEPVAGPDPAPADTRRRYGRVHEALCDFGGEPPVFMLELDDAGRLLQPERSPALAGADRLFLVGVVGEIEATVATVRRPWRPPHGSRTTRTAPDRDRSVAGRFRNGVRRARRVDLAALDDDALGFFPESDRGLILTMRRMRSVCVAAKCWVAPERAPQLREPAHVHLKLLSGQRLD
jgi:hypothetical protein